MKKKEANCDETASDSFNMMDESDGNESDVDIMPDGKKSDNPSLVHLMA